MVKPNWLCSYHSAWSVVAGLTSRIGMPSCKPVDTLMHIDVWIQSFDFTLEVAKIWHTITVVINQLHVLIFQISISLLILLKNMKVTKKPFIIVCIISKFKWHVDEIEMLKALAHYNWNCKKEVTSTQIKFFSQYCSSFCNSFIYGQRFFLPKTSVPNDTFYSSYNNIGHLPWLILVNCIISNTYLGHCARSHYGCSEMGLGVVNWFFFWVGTPIYCCSNKRVINKT